MMQQLELTVENSKNENENPVKLTLDQKKGYFQMLNKYEMDDLYTFYKQDFDLLEYNPMIFD